MTLSASVGAVSRASWETDWEFVIAMWNAIDVPEGLRVAEVTPEGIFMTPPPANSHNNVASRVFEQLVRAVDKDIGVFPELGVGIEGILTIFTPDVCVARYGDLPDDGVPMHAGDVLAAVEITSPSNARTDREGKRRAYAQGDIPQYLLIDRYATNGPTVTLFTEPAHGDYGSARRVAFGEPIRLPEPFDLELDTTGF